MNLRHTLLLAALGLVGCDGGMTMDAGPTPFDAGTPDAGPPPIRYTQFTLRADGWPTAAKVVGAAVLDGVLYVAHTDGVARLPFTETRWSVETTPLSGDLKPTSFQRIDQSLVMTAAGASMGGLFTRELDGPWTQVAGAPTTPQWALVKRSSEYLLSTTGLLMRADSLTGPWTRRSVAGTPLFTRPVKRLVAAPAQQKIFASGDAANNFAGLYESANVGANWAASTTVFGPVEALAASGPIVLVSTSGSPDAGVGQQRSDNYGNTFRRAANPIAEGVTFYLAEGDTFWAGGPGGLKRSDDQGVTFTDASNGLPPGAVTSLTFAGGYVIADTANGPYVNQVP